MQFDVESLKTGLIGISNQDMRVWELVTAVPVIGNVWSYICFGLNVLLPGTGTMLCSCLGDKNVNKTQLIIGLI